MANIYKKGENTVRMPAPNLQLQVLYDEMQLMVNTQTAAQQNIASLHFTR